MYVSVSVCVCLCVSVCICVCLCVFPTIFIGKKAALLTGAVLLINQIPMDKYCKLDICVWPCRGHWFEAVKSKNNANKTFLERQQKAFYKCPVIMLKRKKIEKQLS